MCCHIPKLHIHVSVSDLYIPKIDLPILLQEICGTILGIYKSLTDRRMQKLELRGRAIPRKGIHKWDSRCSAGNLSPNPKKNIVYGMGPYAGVNYNLTLCPPQSRLQHIYHGQPYAGAALNPYARVDFNPMPETTLSPSQGLWVWPQE